MSLDLRLPGRIAQGCRFELEECGLLLSCDKAATIDDFVCFPGPLQAERFSLSFEWMLEQLYLQRSAGHRIAGFFHTHPRGRSVAPSRADRVGHPPGSSVLILSRHAWAFYRVGPEGRRWSQIGEGTFDLLPGFF